MEVIASGQILGDFSGITPTYNLIKTGMVGASTAQTRQIMFDYLDVAYIGSGAEGRAGDNQLYINNMPSIWGEIGLSQTSAVAQVVDVGLAIGVLGFNGAYNAISFSDGRAVNKYSNFHAANEGAVFICMSPDSSDLGGKYQTFNYDNGVFLQADFDGRGSLYLFFTKTNEIYFFHNSQSFNAPFGIIAKNSRHVTIKAFCEPLSVYCLRSKVSIAQGTIENAVGGIAPNCKIYMFRRKDGKLLGSAVSDNQGHYEMITSALSGETVFMVCLDDDNAPDFEGIIYDRITV